MPQKKFKKLKLSKETAIFVVIAAIAFGAASAAFYNLGFQQGLQQTRNIVIEDVINIEQPESDEENGRVDFSIFWEAWDELKQKHPNFDDADKSNLVYGAIKGLTQALGDPNTLFYTPADADRFNEDIRGKFSGVGIEISLRDDRLVVVAPLTGTPAEKAGLKPGDVILAIDGESTTGISIDAAVQKIRGEEGSTVVLTITREGFVSPQDFSIERTSIQIPSVESKYLEDDILYIKIHNFTANTPFLFYSQIVKNVFQNTEGVILDLRNNPGGFLDVSVEAAGWFVGQNKLIVTEEFSSGETQQFFSNSRGVLKDLPLVVLVNEGSASASEILAGAIKFHRDILLIGQPTFGKGTVQELEGLTDGSSIKVTVANWLLPDGTLIEGKGITPDILVEETDQDILDGKDPQLDRALQMLKSQL